MKTVPTSLAQSLQQLSSGGTAQVFPSPVNENAIK